MARYNNFDPDRLIKTLATDSANKEELLYRLKYYLQQIKKLETKAILLNKAIESEASFQASQDKWIRQVTAADRLNAAKLLLQEETERKEAEKLMKESYKLIETLRKEITGEETTFKIAFDVGGAKRGRVYELKLSLSEILDSKLNLTHLSFASSSKVGSAASTIKLRFQDFKAADKRALYQKYLPQMGTKLFDISSQYKNFQEQTKNLGLTLSPGRQYEFFKKAQAKNMYDESTLRKLRDSVVADDLRFTKGVDFAYKDNNGYHFESLKSFIGKSPSLASFTTLLSTLQDVSSAIDQLVSNPAALEEYINFKMQEQQQGISEAAEQSIEESIGSQVVKPMLDQIFPQTSLEDIFNLSST